MRTSLYSTTLIAAWFLISALPSLQATELDSQESHQEFTTDVMPVLSKAGCNLGTCHGNLNGKGGLKLSLRGQDPAFDYHALVRASRGRRISVASPERSLILMKAVGEVPHGGGLRLDRESEHYEILSDWLREGASGPSGTAATLVHLEVSPIEAIVADPQSQVQVRAVATFSDGTIRDVTDTACYELSNLNAEVAPNGLVTRKKHGETTLIVRYLQKQQPIPIAFIQSRPDFQWQAPAPANEIDTHVFAKLQRLRLNPSAPCDDSVFVRRAYLDAIGKAPTSAEAKAFVTSENPNKRTELVDQLLQRPEFADFWALKYADILRTEEKVLDTKGVEVFHGWIRENIASAKPIDQFVRELVTSSGSSFDNPPANYYRANRDPSTRGETTARLFLGTRLQCAKCHNHPFDRWTQEDYYQWASLFSQMKYEGSDAKRQDDLDKNEIPGDETVLITKNDEVKNPNTSQIAPPKFLGGSQLSEDQQQSRLTELAGWMTSPQNDLFVKSQANFIWYQFFGLGVVDPIDDFRLTNPASNPPLMQTLAKELVKSEFDLRSLVAFIMKSQTYQLASEPNETNAFDHTSYSHASVRRLPAEVILDMQSDVLGVPAEFLGQEKGIRAVQLPGVLSKQARRKGPNDGDRFLKTFGKPDRILACDCERSNETTLKQVLMLIGEGLNERIVSPSNRVTELATSDRSDNDVVEELYWSALSRPPTETEMAAATAMIAGHNEQASPDENGTSNNRLVALQDLAWALLNAKEFLFRR
ncbi:DUF1549 and DUF1553 domain-containing protein [Rhodopirellula sp. MGV]|uniref:DUF1549 and DUF1553 domain-containing protein n=1 Tax=Rhodopirellula sp. MGV TaxID=2023130 RepID=UPI000B979DDF|nr:DUF1549 and DUF1553 domain-containing protein [Rhodopirellula sp. MGV]OYP36587.1 hypothetical protein CGZ80_08130 [Rhodopirellula sp. MGV]PNY34564.1 DUF1549 domain-containing protein [Rhodopirellula baltica]